jgi:hypothetical protein
MVSIKTIPLRLPSKYLMLPFCDLKKIGELIDWLISFLTTFTHTIITLNFRTSQFRMQWQYVSKGVMSFGKMEVFQEVVRVSKTFTMFKVLALMVGFVGLNFIFLLMFPQR